MSNLEIILAVIAALTTISFTALIVKGKEVISDALELKDAYQRGIQDGTITDEEKTDIVNCLTELVSDASDLAQALGNLIMRLIGIFKRK